VDDGSTDRTLEISKQLIENDKKATQLRTIYFQNKERKFINDNVRWAAENFCSKKEVMVVLDG
jgi:glycosyltransferase involved in cell wall biosynthesis